MRPRFAGGLLAQASENSLRSTFFFCRRARTAEQLIETMLKLFVIVLAKKTASLGAC